MNKFLIVLIFSPIFAQKLFNISIHELTTTKFYELPPPPYCQFTQSSTLLTTPLLVTLWDVDTSTAIGTAQIVEKHSISTTCTYYFFGAQEQTIEKDTTMVCDDKCVQVVSGNPLQLNTFPKFKCSWPGSRSYLHDVYQITETQIFLSDSMKIWTENSVWTCDESLSICRSNGKILKTHLNKIPQCHLTKLSVEKGIKSSNAQNNTLVAIPSRNLLFTLPPFPNLISCGHIPNLYLTSLHYLISLDNVTDHVADSRELHFWLIPSVLSHRSGASSQINSYLNKFTNNQNNLKNDLTQVMCRAKEDEWQLASVSNNANLWARYITGYQYAVGNFYQGQIQIYHLKQSYALINTEETKLSLSGLITITIGSQRYEVEPVSGILGLNHSRFSYGLGWLPLASHGFYDIKTKRIVQDSPTNNDDIDFIPLTTLNLTKQRFLKQVTYAKSLSSETEYSNIFIEFFQWIESWGKTLQMCTLVIIISGFIWILWKLKQKCLNPQTRVPEGIPSPISPKVLYKIQEAIDA